MDLGYLADKSQTAPKISVLFFKTILKLEVDTVETHALTFLYTIFLPLADVECDRISILFKFLYQTAVILAQLFGAEKFFKISFFLARGKTKYHSTLCLNHKKNFTKDILGDKRGKDAF